MQDQIFAIAVDGPAGAGKSTIARLVAERLGFIYVDSDRAMLDASDITYQTIHGNCLVLVGGNH